MLFRAETSLGLARDRLAFGTTTDPVAPYYEIDDGLQVRLPLGTAADSTPVVSVPISLSVMMSAAAFCVSGLSGLTE